MQFENYTYDDLVREFCYTHNNLASYCEPIDLENIYYEDFDINGAISNVEQIGEYIRSIGADDQLFYAYGICNIVLNELCSRC